MLELNFIFRSIFCRTGNAIASWVAVRSSLFLSFLLFVFTFGFLIGQTQQGKDVFE